MTLQEGKVEPDEARRKAWRAVLTALIALFCLPSSYLGLLWLVRLFLKGNSAHGELFVAITYMAYLVSSAFGAYIWILALVLWIVQIRMGARTQSKVISAGFLILALIGMLARNVVMK